MSRFRGRRSRLIAMAVVLLCFGTACSRPLGLHGSDGAAQTQQPQVPFHGNTAQNPSADGVAAAEESGQKRETGLPFHDSQSLPVGTLVTVRLKDPISTEGRRPSGTFEAIVDDPVTLDGNAIVPRGARVAGRVESARASKTKRNQNYVRLTLDSIDVSGRGLPVQTSSLFAHGKSAAGAAAGGEGATEVIRLEKGRRLTFRLTEPVYIASQQPASLH